MRKQLLLKAGQSCRDNSTGLIHQATDAAVVLGEAGERGYIRGAGVGIIVVVGVGDGVTDGSDGVGVAVGVGVGRETRLRAVFPAGVQIAVGCRIRPK